MKPIDLAKHPRVDTPPHGCEAAETISSTLNVFGLDVTITAFDRSPDSMGKVTRLTETLASIFGLFDRS